MVWGFQAMTLLTKDPFGSAFDALKFQIGDRILIVENLIASAENLIISWLFELLNLDTQSLYNNSFKRCIINFVRKI